MVTTWRGRETRQLLVATHNPTAYVGDTAAKHSTHGDARRNLWQTRGHDAQRDTWCRRHTAALWRDNMMQSWCGGTGATHFTVGNTRVTRGQVMTQRQVQAWAKPVATCGAGDTRRQPSGAGVPFVVRSLSHLHINHYA